jgi:hypothetical protein
VKDNPPLEKTDAFLFIAKVGSGIGFGIVIAIVWSLEGGPDGITYRIGFGSVIAFAIGMIIALLYWKVVQGMLMVGSPNQDPKAPPALCKKRFAIFSGILLLLSVLAFLYPIFRFTPAEKYKDLAFGIILAFAVLGGVARVMWKLKGMLDADEKENSIGKKPE